MALIAEAARGLITDLLFRSVGLLRIGPALFPMEMPPFLTFLCCRQIRCRLLPELIPRKRAPIRPAKDSFHLQKLKKGAFRPLLLAYPPTNFMR